MAGCLLAARFCCVCVSLCVLWGFFRRFCLGQCEERTLRVTESLWLIHGDNESDGRGGTVAVVSLRNKKLEFMSGCVAYAAMRDGIEAGVLFFFFPCDMRRTAGGWINWPLSESTRWDSTTCTYTCNYYCYPVSFYFML